MRNSVFMARRVCARYSSKQQLTITWVNVSRVWKIWRAVCEKCVPRVIARGRLWMDKRWGPRRTSLTSEGRDYHSWVCAAPLPATVPWACAGAPVFCLLRPDEAGRRGRVLGGCPRARVRVRPTRRARQRWEWECRTPNKSAIAMADQIGWERPKKRVLVATFLEAKYCSRRRYIVVQTKEGREVYNQSKKYCPVLVAQEGSAVWGNTLATAL